MRRRECKRYLLRLISNNKIEVFSKLPNEITDEEDRLKLILVTNRGPNPGAFFQSRDFGIGIAFNPGIPGLM